MWIPTDDQIRDLHRELAPTPAAFDLVHTHVEIVAELAAHFLATRPHRLDAGLVRAGALLHDIGVYRLYQPDGTLDHANYLRHGILGHEVLRDRGFPEVLARFCSCHTGMGISRADVVEQHLPLPVADYLAETEEERLVMFADKFHSKTTPPRFVSPASALADLRRFGEDKVDRFAAMIERYGEPDLASPADKYRHAIG